MALNEAARLTVAEFGWHIASTFAHVEQLLYRCGRQLLRLANEPRDQVDLGKMLQRLHLSIGRFKIAAVSHRAVIRQQQRVVMRDVGRQRFG